MSDGTELTPVEFDLEVPITFEAKDLVRNLSPEQVIKLIKELDTELNEWGATIILASYFGDQLSAAPPEELSKSNELLLAELMAASTEGDAE
jgi:hypothetical protein